MRAVAHAFVLLPLCLLAAPLHAQWNSPGGVYRGPGDVSPPTSGPSSPGPATPGPGSPGAPTTGGPAHPQVPAPTPGPNAPPTGAPAGPKTPGPAGPRTPGGNNRLPIVFTHGRTVQERLEIDWSYPVVASRARPGETRAPYRVLPREQAFALIAGNDRRPLLVVRECDACRGSDDALLSRKLDNDRTLVLAQWFHCVKLPAHVLDNRHPLHEVFCHESWIGKPYPHVFLADRSGAEVVPFDGMQSQSDLWKAMAAFLDKAYEGNAENAVRELLKLYPQIDRVDARIEHVAQQIDAELEEKGAGRARLGDLQEKYAELVAERKQLMTREAELRGLALK